MLLVPVQYFLGTVYFFSKTLLTKSAVCLNTRGHISIVCVENSHSWPLPLDAARHTAGAPTPTASVYLSCRVKHKEEVLTNRCITAMFS